jgi:hypothetical protein
MLSPQLFFLHFNKTAGTSFYRYLESHYATDEYIPDAEVPAMQRAKFEHKAFISKLAELKLVTKLHLNTRYLNDLRACQPSFKAVTVFRNPIARTYSQIEAWRRVPDVILSNVTPDRYQLLMDARQLPVEAFVEKHWARLSNRQSKMTAGVEQNEPIADTSTLIDAARNELAKIDFVGLTHKLPELAFQLSWSLGLYNGFNDYRLNAARAEHHLSPLEKDAIAEQVIALNDADQPLYLDAERRAFIQYSDAKYAIFQHSGRAPQPRLLTNQESYTLTMEQPLFGEGWHEREAGILGSARWAGPNRLSTLYLPASHTKPAKLRFMIASLIDPSLLSNLRIDANDHPLTFTSQIEEGFLVLETEALPPSGEPHTMRIVFESEKSISASMVGSSTDDRQKTIALERVQLTPVHFDD